MTGWSLAAMHLSSFSSKRRAARVGPRDVLPEHRLLGAPGPGEHGQAPPEIQHIGRHVIRRRLGGDHCAFRPSHLLRRGRLGVLKVLGGFRQRCRRDFLTLSVVGLFLRAGIHQLVDEPLEVIVDGRRQCRPP
ncbi:Os03g0589766 [Oryza sativa Japonica Group]|uniref:Os03g0589766 protein n=1 Tax=Oryza sativa subsp. japonica TaxID=39947 RepID=A0A0P0VZW5_ORYSJ|nr:Os03g0589766 [Oryza sativa Japonica Group]